MAEVIVRVISNNTQYDCEVNGDCYSYPPPKVVNYTNTSTTNETLTVRLTFDVSSNVSNITYGVSPDCTSLNSTLNASFSLIHDFHLQNLLVGL